MRLSTHLLAWRRVHNPLINTDGDVVGDFRAAKGPRASEMDRKAAALGRKLAKGLETEEEEEEEEEDFYDVSDMEVSGIVFSPVKRYLWLYSSCMGCGVGGASSWGDCWGQSCISWHFASIKFQKISVFPNRS